MATFFAPTANKGDNKIELSSARLSRAEIASWGLVGTACLMLVLSVVFVVRDSQDVPLATSPLQLGSPNSHVSTTPAQSLNSDTQILAPAQTTEPTIIAAAPFMATASAITPTAIAAPIPKTDIPFISVQPTPTLPPTGSGSNQPSSNNNVTPPVTGPPADETTTTQTTQPPTTTTTTPPTTEPPTTEPPSTEPPTTEPPTTETPTTDVPPTTDTTVPALIDLGSITTLPDLGLGD